MKKAILFISLILACGDLWAGKLDIDYIRPSPTKALMYSVIFPGGGYYYLNDVERYSEYVANGLIFTLGSAAIILLATSQAKNGLPLTTVAGVIGFIGFRILEFDSVVDDAEKARYANSLKHER